MTIRRLTTARPSRSRRSTYYEANGFGLEDRIYVVILDAHVPLGTVFNLGGTEFTSDAGSRVGSGTHIWSRPADFAWIHGQEVRVSANLAPAPESATVEGTTLVLTHSEDLDTGSVPAAIAYTVKVDGDAGTNPSAVSVGTRTVTLALATAVTSTGSTVTLSYDRAGEQSVARPIGPQCAGLRRPRGGQQHGPPWSATRI